MNFTLLLPCSLPPPEHGNGSTPIDHRLAFDAERIPSIVVSAPQIQHLITPTGQSRLDRGATKCGMNGRCATTGKSPLGTLRGQRFERAPFLRVRSHSLPGLPQLPSTPAHRHGVGLPRHIDRQSSKAHHKVERRFHHCCLILLSNRGASFLSLR